MGTRGRKSRASFENGEDREGVAAGLQEPDGLTAPQRMLWHEVVEAKPDDWFRGDSAPVLEAYVKTVDHYRAMAQLLDRTPKNLLDHERLARMVLHQTKMIKTLATSLRLTPQARYMPRVAARLDRDTPTSRPWND